MKGKRNTFNSYRVGIVLNELIDKDLQSMILPLNLMQMILMNPKYRIKNEMITPNNLFNKFVLLFGTITFIYAYVYRVIHETDENLKIYQFVNFQHIATCYDLCYYCVGFVMNFLVNLLQTRKNVTLILTIQKVHRFLNDKTKFKSFINGNWIIVAIIFGFYVIFSIYNYIIYSEIPFYLFFTMFILVNFDANIVYAIRLIKLLEDKVVLLNDQVLNSNSVELCNERLFQAYIQILKCYEIYKITFQQMVSQNNPYLYNISKQE